MNKKNIEVCFSPLSFPLFKREESIVVVIDVLRATSAICTALFHGAAMIIPVSSIEEAREYRAKGFLIAAERNAEMIDGFDFGNSPFNYMGEHIKGTTIALTTTNGTQAIEIAKKSNKVVIGSFLNLDILCQWLMDQQKDVILLCAGWKNKFNLEDTLCSGAIALNLLDTGKYETMCDSTLAAKRLYNIANGNMNEFLKNSSHRKRLKKLDLEKDIQYCLTPNQTPIIPVLDGIGLIRMEITANL